MKKYVGSCLLLGAICLVVAVPQRIMAVQSSIQVLANVVSSLAVAGATNLDFGDVTPGIAKSIDQKASASAGVWNITSAGTPEVQISFVNLPGQLISGADVLNIAYTASVGTVQATSTDILSLAAGTTSFLVAGALDVWIGGTVFPSSSQPGGAYSATVILEVTLTGN